MSYHGWEEEWQLCHENRLAEIYQHMHFDSSQALLFLPPASQDTGFPGGFVWAHAGDTDNELHAEWSQLGVVMICLGECSHTWPYALATAAPT